MTKRLTLPLALLGMTLLLSACGFKLRGMMDVPDALRQVQLEVASPNSQIEDELRRALTANRIALTGDARYRLTLLRERHSRRSATLTGNADVAEYELRSEAWFSVIDREQDNQPVIDARRVMLERVYSNDPDNITASGSQESLIRQQMQQDLAQQILRQFLSIRSGS